MAAVGYERVSTDGQSLTADCRAEGTGCVEIFKEKVSGAKPIASSWRG